MASDAKEMTLELSNNWHTVLSADFSSSGKNCRQLFIFIVADHGQTEEVRQKLSDVRRAAWEQGLYDQCFQSPTTIEIAISEALDKLSIEHIRQYRPDGCSYIYDEYLPLLGILLEVNGDYWHTREGVP